MVRAAALHREALIIERLGNRLVAHASFPHLNDSRHDILVELACLLSSQLGRDLRSLTSMPA